MEEEMNLVDSCNTNSIHRERKIFLDPNSGGPKMF
jgi:hypothetical protein